MEFILQDKELFLYLNNLGNPAFDVLDTALRRIIVFIV